MKVYEEDFNRTIVIVKNCCIKVAQTLISKLQWWFLEQEVMMVLKIVYPNISLIMHSFYI
jgi:hypothetical protein